MQLFLDQVFVVGHSDFGGAEFVEARGEHVAEKLDGVVGALGEFVDVEQHGVQFRGSAGGAPASPEPGASGVEEVVDLFEFLGEQLVVVAELEQLRVGVLEELDGGLGAGLRVVDEGGIPSDDREVAGIVRDAGLQNFLALAVGECGHLSANNLGDLVALRGEKFVRGRRAVDLANVEDEVVLLQQFGGVRLDQRGGGAFEFLPDDARGELLEIGVGGPAAREFDESVPPAGKR